MGCCDSNQSQYVHPIHQQTIEKIKSQIKESERSRKYYQNIFLINANQIETDPSIKRLNSNLQSILTNFQKDYGPLKTTDLSFKTLHENKENISFDSFGKSHSKTQSLIKTITPDMRSLSYNDTSFTSDPSQQLTSKNNILMNTSLNKSFELKKDRFYDNSRYVNHVQYEQWGQRNRFSVKFFKHECFQEMNNTLFNTMMNIFLFQDRNELNLISGNKIVKRGRQEEGIRVFVNGNKRFFPTPSDISLEVDGGKAIRYFLAHINKYKKIRVCFCLFYLSGWIPQIINLNEVKQKTGIFDRLATNFFQENIIITFSTQNQEDTAILADISMNNSMLSLATKKYSREKQKYEENIESIEWSFLLLRYDYIQVNWNPSIYDISLKFQVLVQKNVQNNYQKYSQFFIRIPITNSDVEIRVLIEKHSEIYEENEEQYSLQLYDYMKRKVKEIDEPIRVNKFSNIQISSQVLVFEASDEISEYVLLLKPLNMGKYVERQFTIKFHSFTQISVKTLLQQNIVDQKQTTSFLHYYQAGYGLNSPFFYQNVQYSVRVPIYQNIRVSVLSHEDHAFEMCLLGDPEETKDLTKVNIQELMKGMQQSTQLRGQGHLDIETRFENYILVIASYTKLKTKMQIKVERILKGKKHVEIKPFELYLQEIFLNLNIIYEAKIQWKRIDPGPRKRYKDNSVPGYQPQKNFIQFFKNPNIDKKLQKGVYQFNIFSLTYLESFKRITETENIEQIMVEQAPSLSIGIFKKGNNNYYKILLDDAFYVPFGTGFWSKQIYLEKGEYKFVFPKLQKDNSIGVFRIRQI